jgi:hypothetical protein
MEEEAPDPVRAGDSRAAAAWMTRCGGFSLLLRLRGRLAVMHHSYGREVLLTSGKSLNALTIVNHRLCRLLGSIRRKCEVNLS